MLRVICEPYGGGDSGGGVPAGRAFWMRTMMLAAGAAALWAAGVAAAPVAVPDGQPVLGAYAITIGVNPDTQVATPNVSFQTSGLEANASSTPAPDTSISARAVGSAWTAKAEIVGVNGSAAQAGFIYSASSINQVLQGQEGASARLTYQFRLDGNFAPGPQDKMATGFSQYMASYLLAYKGHFIGYEVVQQNGAADMRAVSTNGAISVLQGFGHPLYVDTLSDDLIAAARYCKNLDANCDGTSGAFDRTLEISFNVKVGEAFSVVSALLGRTNGTLDLWNTMELEQIIVPEGFELVVEDGGLLQRRPDGSYGLPAVPEPATWVMLIAGFGLVGAVARRRQVISA